MSTGRIAIRKNRIARAEKDLNSAKELLVSDKEKFDKAAEAYASKLLEFKNADCPKEQARLNSELIKLERIFLSKFALLAESKKILAGWGE